MHEFIVGDKVDVLIGGVWVPGSVSSVYCGVLVYSLGDRGLYARSDKVSGARFRFDDDDMVVYPGHTSKWRYGALRGCKRDNLLPYRALPCTES